MLLMRAINSVFSNDTNCPVQNANNLPSEKSFMACYNLCEIFSVTYAAVFLFFALFLTHTDV